MSNRRNFLIAMGATASSLVISNLGKGVINPSYAQASQRVICTIDNSLLIKIVKLGFGVLGTLAKAIVGLAGVAKSASDSALTSLSAEVEKAADADSAFWSDPDNFTGFIRGITVDEQTRAAQSLKGKFSNKQITDAVNGALKNLEANNISAIEKDPIIGSVVTAGYTAAAGKLKQASAQRKTAEVGLGQVREVIGVKIETEVSRLKKESKITNSDIEKFSAVYPSLAPRLKRAIDLKALPTSPPGIQRPGFGIPEQNPGNQNPGNQRPNSTLINQLPLDAGDAVSDASASNRNEFDVYVGIFENRLLALNTPTNGESELTVMDRLLGIEKANAVVDLLLILAIVIVGAILIITVVGAVSEALKNILCARAIRGLQAYVECRNRADATRRSRLAEARRSFNSCQSSLGILSALCIPGHVAERAAIEISYNIASAACAF